MVILSIELKQSITFTKKSDICVTIVLFKELFQWKMCFFFVFLVYKSVVQRTEFFYVRHNFSRMFLTIWHQIYDTKQSKKHMITCECFFRYSRPWLSPKYFSLINDEGIFLQYFFLLLWLSQDSTNGVNRIWIVTFNFDFSLFICDGIAHSPYRLQNTVESDWKKNFS